MSTSGLAQLGAQFESAIRQRGEAYASAGRVDIEMLDDFGALATVRGSQAYRVTLLRDASRVSVACTCPYAEHTLCKHIWALLVTVQDEPLLQPPADGKRLALQLGDADDYDFDDRDEPPRSRAAAPIPTQAKTKSTAWRRRLKEVGEMSMSHGHAAQEWPSTRQLLYVIDAPATSQSGVVSLSVLSRDARKDGSWNKAKTRALTHDLINTLPDVADRRVLALLTGADQWYPGSYARFTSSGYHGGVDGNYPLPSHFQLRDRQAQELLPILCATTRCCLRLRAADDESQWTALTLDLQDAWGFKFAVQRVSPDRYELRGSLRRAGQVIDVREPVLVLQTGLMVVQSGIARYEPETAYSWIWSLRQKGTLSASAREVEAFVDELLQQPSLPPIDLPESLRYEEIVLAPQPRLQLRPVRSSWEGDKLIGEFGFLYADVAVVHDDPRSVLLRKAQRQCLRRDVQAERAARQQLIDAGLRPRAASGMDVHETFTLATRHLSAAVTELLTAGWQVEAQGRLYRHAGRIDVQVQSGIDWFELHAEAHFGDQVAHLPELLEAARKGESFVKLGDGTLGVLPSDWLKQHGGLAGVGTAHEDHLRFNRSQAGLLDALLAQQPQADCDEAFRKLRADLARFGGIGPLDPPAGFQGTLREYQREALGWFAFLRQYGFGGCLADDMGLGKTVQVLAMLEARREARAQQKEARRGKRVVTDARPTLIVVPRSLIYNWIREAARFTPQLRVLDHTGSARRKDRAHLEEWDVVLTTYGTLRRDAADFMEVQFDYVVLDEAQAIKNAASDSAKAVRLLKADHRLALSGTPIENHIGELWSLFEFLNPGMFGRATAFKAVAGNTVDDDARRVIAQALRPFLLRRTKEQVARDLPARVEQTLYCELETRQRKHYDELRDHYRSALLGRIATEGMARSKMQILEALLRLRQAAIHPGLIDDKLKRDPSAKLDMLLPRLMEVIDEGHKALVFSQFTGVLALVRAELDRTGTTYAYLDGKTRDREACVQRFQTDPECRLFLISLKAGGVGLNLTAAQYVFLLDPWWNPAVEAQAIDRAHRIGQTQQVFAYRLIARDTVEERILELQQSKRSLADAIVNADNALIRTLGKEDLELLLE